MIRSNKMHILSPSPTEYYRLFWCFFRYFLQFRNFLSFTAPLPPRHITNSIHIMKYNYMAALFAFLFTIVSVDKFLQMEKLLLNYRPQLQSVLWDSKAGCMHNFHFLSTERYFFFCWTICHKVAYKFNWANAWVVEAFDSLRSPVFIVPFIETSFNCCSSHQSALFQK